MTGRLIAEHINGRNWWNETTEKRASPSLADGDGPVVVRIVPLIVARFDFGPPVLGFALGRIGSERVVALASFGGGNGVIFGEIPIPRLVV
ncbi:MAG: hypothetical protein ACJAXA_002452 [Candidatus Aldehydirespiratoraceae bacterium]|jgi:hypothetical protein